MQFVQTIIHDIYRTRTSAIEFLCRSRRSWHAREQTRPRATSVDPVFIEELEEDETMEAQIVQTDTGERTLLKQKYSHPQRCRCKYNNPQRCKQWQKHNKGQWRWRGVNWKLQLREDVQSWTKLHVWRKVLKFEILTNSCGHKQNKIMINMLSKWRTRRILLRKKTKLLKQGLLFCF